MITYYQARQKFRKDIMHYIPLKECFLQAPLVYMKIGLDAMFLRVGLLSTNPVTLGIHVFTE